MRRQSAESGSAQPAIVWGRPAPAPAPAIDAASAIATAALAASLADSAASAPSSTRRAARARRLATGELPVVSDAAPVRIAGEATEVQPAVAAITTGGIGVERQASLVDERALGSTRLEAGGFELIEPAIAAAQIAPAPVLEQLGTAADVDEFEAAARLFSFTGETAVQSGAPATQTTDAPDAAADAAPEVAHIASRRSRVAGLKRAAATTFSIGVVGIVGLLAVGMTTPAEAVAAVNGTVPNGGASASSDIVAPSGERVSIDPDEIQAYVAPAEIQSAPLDRPESYAMASLADLAAELGIKHPSDFYVNDPNAAIQWPFAVGVGISWGFVWRDGRQHEGADFTPGEGAHVQAIADGTVRIATENGGGYGVTVLIDHIIDGKLVSSRYGHMLVGSLQVKAGDQVKVGQYLGRTGNTGHSFGAHTHFEILANGTTAIDPIAWLRANAGRDSLG